MLSGIMRCQPADINIVGIAQSRHIRIAGSVPYFIGPPLRSRIGPGLSPRMAVRISKHSHIVVKDCDSIDQDKLIRIERPRIHIIVPIVIFLYNDVCGTGILYLRYPDQAIAVRG